jgi:hypothetical protein
MSEKKAWPWAVAAGLLSPCHTVPLVLALVATGPLSRFRGLFAAVMVFVFFGLLARAIFFNGSCCKGAQQRAEFR